MCIRDRDGELVAVVADGVQVAGRGAHGEAELVWVGGAQRLDVVGGLAGVVVADEVEDLIEVRRHWGWHADQLTSHITSHITSHMWDVMWDVPPKKWYVGRVHAGQTT